MSGPTPMAPAFAPSPLSTAGEPGPSPALLRRLAQLTPEQLAHLERSLDALEAGATPPRGPAPLEVVGTRFWWSAPEVTSAPLAVQRVRGLGPIVVVQFDERMRTPGASFGAPGAFALTCCTSPELVHRVWENGAPVGHAGPGRGRAAGFAGLVPWAGYAPRVEAQDEDEGQPGDDARAARRQRNKAG